MLGRSRAAVCLSLLALACGGDDSQSTGSASEDASTSDTADTASTSPTTTVGDTMSTTAGETTGSSSTETTSPGTTGTSDETATDTQGTDTTGGETETDTGITDTTDATTGTGTDADTTGTTGDTTGTTGVMMDDTPPEVMAVHAPPNPIEGQVVTVTVSASDPESAITETEVWIDDVLVNTCMLDVCDDAAVHAPGLHTYYGTATSEGGMTVGSVGMFTVTALPEKTVFITSTQYNGNLGGPSGADARCQMRAQAAGLPGTYVAILSHEKDPGGNPAPQLDARDRFTNCKLVRTDGQPVAGSCPELWSGTLQNPIRYNEFGNYVDSVPVWTATAADGTYKPNVGSCYGWVQQSQNIFGYRGVGFATNSQWVDTGNWNCGTMVARLYCVQL